MSGYNPVDPPPNRVSLNWFQRWRANRRHKKAESKRNLMKLLNGIFTPPEYQNHMFHFIDSLSDEDILCRAGKESYRK